MANQEKMIIVDLIENDPILGVKYGEREIVIDKDAIRREHVKKYLAMKARNRHLIHRHRTMQK